MHLRYWASQFEIRIFITVLLAGNTSCTEILNYAGEESISNEASEEDRRADFVNSLLRSSEVAGVTDRSFNEKSQEPHSKENRSAHDNEDTRSMFLVWVQ